MAHGQRSIPRKPGQSTARSVTQPCISFQSAWIIMLKGSSWTSGTGDYQDACVITESKQEEAMSVSLKVLGISGSLRRKSTNTGLLRAAQKVVPDGMTLEIAEIGDVPLYNADVAEQGKPPAAARIIEKIEAADALVFACPEYNYSLAPALKNVIDWASREPENRVLKGMPVAIMGAAGGMGSSRAQYHLRQVCVFTDMHPINKPEVFSNAFSNSFDESGDLVDAKIIQLITDQLQALAAWAHRLKQG